MRLTKKGNVLLISCNAISYVWIHWYWYLIKHHRRISLRGSVIKWRENNWWREVRTWTINNNGITSLEMWILCCRLKWIPLITIAVRSHVKHAVNQPLVDMRNVSKKSNVEQPNERNRSFSIINIWLTSKWIKWKGKSERAIGEIIDKVSR